MRKTFALLVLVSSAVVAASAQHNPVATTPASTKNAHARTQTIDDLAGKLVERFYDAELGKRYAATLRANLLAGKYDGFTDEAAFAAQVTADLQAVAFDGHLKLSPQPDDGPPRPPADSPTALSKTVEAQARLTPEVAYLRLGNFFGQPEGLAAVRKFMDDNRDAKTLIFDVRTHVGGGLDEMDLMFPYLFDKETVLVAMDTRSTVPGPLEDGPRLRTVAGPSTVVRREHFVVPAAGYRPLSKAKIFVLAGKDRLGGRAFRSRNASYAQSDSYWRIHLRRRKLRFIPKDCGRLSGLHTGRSFVRPGYGEGLGLRRRRAGYHGSGCASAYGGFGSKRS